MIVPHPIPYQGSKRVIANLILSYFPMNVSRLVEPFAGSGALSIAAALQKKAACFHLNDTNEPLVNLWRAMLENPVQLANDYEKLWRQQRGRERKFYDDVQYLRQSKDKLQICPTFLARFLGLARVLDVRKEFNQTHQAAHLLYLLARCVKASVRYNAAGEFNQSPDNRRKGRHPENMRRDILLTARLLAGRTTLSANDYRQVLE